MSLVLASYNIHRCYGRDGRFDPARIRRVLRQLGAQVIALQEVELAHDANDLLEYFCEQGPWQAIHGPTLTRSSGHYGNALLTALPIRTCQRIDLSQPGREPRGAVLAQLDHPDTPLTVMATHLGLRPGERRQQVRRLLAQLQQHETKAKTSTVTALMGDINEWWLWGRPLRWLHRHFQRPPSPPSFPARYPLFALDRIWIKPRASLLGIEAVDNSLTRCASDHLPVIARLG